MYSLPPLPGEPLTVAPSKQQQQQPLQPSPLLSSQMSPQHKQQQQQGASISPPPQAAAANSTSYQQPQAPPPMVIEPVNFSPPRPAVAQTSQAMASLSLQATATPQNVSHYLKILVLMWISIHYGEEGSGIYILLI